MDAKTRECIPTECEQVNLCTELELEEVYRPRIPFRWVCGDNKSSLDVERACPAGRLFHSEFGRCNPKLAVPEEESVEQVKHLLASCHEMSEECSADCRPVDGGGCTPSDQTLLAHRAMLCDTPKELTNPVRLEDGTSLCGQSA